MSNGIYQCFSESFYSLWLGDIPESIIKSAILDIERKHESKLIKRRCHKLYEEYVVLETVLFVLAFFQIKGGLSVSVDNKDIHLKDITDSGISSTIKKDTVGGSISREYYEPKLPDGLSMEDFPYGRIKSELNHIKDICSPSVRLGGFGSSRSSYKGSHKRGRCGEKWMAEGYFQ